MSFTALKNQKSNLKKVILWAVGLYVMIGTILYTIQEKILFLPTTLEQDYQYKFETSFEELFIKTEDGSRLNGLHFKAENPKGVVLYFHGNAGDLSRWGLIVEPFTKYNYDVIVMDYRTYGKSTGALSEKNLYEDAQLFFGYTKEHFDDKDIIIYGRSLGTGIASKLASQNNIQQLILETPYTTIVDVGKHRFPIFPVETLLKYKLPTVEYLKNVDCPITIFHGTADDVVPYKFGKELKEKYSNKIEMITIEGGGHNDLANYMAYHENLKKVLN
ncbi:alpha/beta hydrolase [Winogradskyella sp. A3E31]|uniref:alpha/beta hydrolase n=1 Tax=Winogradskyella sp. A3E31 TaxID=3349637 RepID=UPI00398ABBA8